jgi:N-acetylmuramoyl-L-alanine amidase
MDMDLTQTSYSTIPSVDIELGDKVSDHSKTTIDNLAQGLADGIDQFFVN